MTLSAIKVLGLAVLAAGGLSLAGCMQDGARQVSAAAPQATTPAFGLYYMDEGASAKLAYGQANSDNVALMMQCTKGSRTVEVTDAMSASSSPVLTLVSAGQSAKLNAHSEAGDGAMLLVARTPSTAAPLSAFRRSGKLEVAYAGGSYGVNASPNERVGVERFFAACERAAG